MLSTVPYSEEEGSSFTDNRFKNATCIFCNLPIISSSPFTLLPFTNGIICDVPFVTVVGGDDEDEGLEADVEDNVNDRGERASGKRREVGRGSNRFFDSLSGQFVFVKLMN